MNAEQLASTLGAKKAGSGWSARCPAHEDKTASLSISTGNNGKVLLYCFAGCETAEIARAAGLEMSDLFPPDTDPTASTKPRIVAEYNYRDENGAILYQVVRLDPKSFRQRKADQSGGWSWSVRGVRKVLYRLDSISACTKGTAIFLVEGEKDADALATLGLQATTNAGGSSKWHEEYARQLTGLRVVILPDNDEPGEKHAESISESLGEACVQHTILRLPGLPEKGDVSDWLATGGTRDQLVDMARSALVKSQPDEFVQVGNRIEEGRVTRGRLAEKVIPFNISFLDDICLGIHPTDLVILSAASGAGKTTLGALIAEKAAEQKRRVCFFALEAHRNEIEQRLLFREICSQACEREDPLKGVSFNRWMYGQCNHLSAYEGKAMQALQRKLATMSTYYRTTEFGHRDITKTFEAISKESDLIILDHLHYIDLDGGNENYEMKKVIKAIRNAVLGIEVPVVVIAHVRKRDSKNRGQIIPGMEDIHGSSDVIKIATKVITIAPLQGILPCAEQGIAHTAMCVAKDRYAGATRYAAIMRYNTSTLDYDTGYGLCTLSYDATSMSQMVPGTLPSWSIHGAGMRGDLPDIKDGKAVER